MRCPRCGEECKSRPGCPLNIHEIERKMLLLASLLGALVVVLALMVLLSIGGLR